MFGLKAGILASVASGATMLPQPVFDVDRVWPESRRRASLCSRSPDVVQSILDHPHHAKHDLSSLRVAVTGSADIPVELIRRVDEELPYSNIVTGYGLTEAAPPAPRPRATMQRRSPPQWVGHGPASSCASSVTAAWTSERDSRAKYCSAAAASWWGTSTTPRRRRRSCRTTAGCAPVTSARSTRPGCSASWVGQGHVHRRRLQRLSRRDREHVAAASRRAAGRGDRHPDHRLGEVGMAFVVASEDISSHDIIEWSGTKSPSTRSPASWRSSTRCPQRHRQGAQGRAPGASPSRSVR